MRMKPTKWKNQFGEGNIGDKPYSKYSNLASTSVQRFLKNEQKNS